MNEEQIAGIAEGGATEEQAAEILAELRRMQDDDRQQRTADEKRAVDGRDAPAIDASINAPHTISVHGRAVAINIREPSAAALRAAGGMGNLILTLSKNGIPTDYRISGVEVA